MFKKLSLAGAAFAIATTSLIGATPASAQYYNNGHQGGYHQDYRGDDRGDYRGDYRDGDRRYDDRYNGYNQRGYDDRRYDDRRYAYRQDYRRRCSDGTGGALIGAIAGGLFGNAVAGRGDRTAGTIIGGLGGALAGRAIDRSNNRCYR